MGSIYTDGTYLPRHGIAPKSACDVGCGAGKSRLLNGPRRALFAIDPDAAVRLLGGYSLLVLAE